MGDARFSGFKSALQWMAVTLGAASLTGRNKKGTKFSLEHSLILDASPRISIGNAMEAERLSPPRTWD